MLLPNRSTFAAAIIAVALPALAGAAVAAPTPAGPQTIIAGTVIDTQIDREISSKTNKNGDQFALVPKTGGFFHKNPNLGGCVFVGHIENVTAAGPTHKATMNAILDGAQCPGESGLQPMKLKLLSAKEFEAQNHIMRDTALVVGGAVAGHMVAGQSHGGLAGAAGGVALASTLKSDIVLKKGTVVTVKTLEPMTVPAATK
jgi:hypothetical protein